MAKNVKKAKPASKGVLKPAAKALKKLVKAALPAKKVAAKPAAKKPVVAKPVAKAAAKRPVVGKPAAPALPKAAAQKKPVLEKSVEKPVAKAKPKAESKAKKAKVAPEDLDDDLMVSDDEEMGGEEIPDLSDFDEDEEEIDSEDLEIAEESLGVVAGANQGTDDEAILTDAEGRPYCKVRDCDQIAGVDGYCRYHYLLLWKKIQVRRKILADGKLERYVDELTARYPDKFLEMIKRDLRTEKDFLSAIAELEIDESAGENEFDDDSQVIDEVRGFGSESSSMSEDEEF
ncbi:MAG: hypothetical protein ACK5P7_08210 [Bdellovibrio sp.]|jgi:hypothetical protein